MEHFIIRTTVRYRIQSKDTMLYKEDSNVCRCTYLRSFSIRHLNCSSFLQHIGALSFTIRHEFQTFLIYQQVQLLILEHQHPYFVETHATKVCLFCYDLNTSNCSQHEVLKFLLTLGCHKMRDFESLHSQ